MRTFSEYIKMALAVLVVLTCTVLCALRLMKIQVVNSQAYQKENIVTTSYTQKIPATRGEIVDAAGTILIGNHVDYAIVIDEESFPKELGEGNAVLLRLTQILADAGTEWEDTLPITKSAPYHFLPDADTSRLDAVKEKIGVNAYATAENCMTVLCDTFGISDEYTQREQRIIAGIRFTMLDREFSASFRFQLADGLTMNTVTRVSGLFMQLPGVSILQTADRVIEVGDVIPHELGTTGPIFAENAEEYLAQGYSLDAIVGVSGIEKAMESELQGKEGTRTITYVGSDAVSDEITEAAVPGHTVRLTVNSEFQRGLQDILDNFLANFHSINRKPELARNAVNSGALVVLDAKTGAIIGEVTAPTYDLTLYSEQYDTLIADESNPLFNRATMGLYRPGSTFKTITATAGLNEGIVGGGTAFTCIRTYHYIDTNYSCTGYHGSIAVAQALKVSCNSYFYELSKRLTIDRITDYAALYGIGQNTGIETMDSQGYMASPEQYRKLGIDWTVGQVLQAGIGNGDTMVTPLQLANVACTIANKGVRYQPYLVDSIWDYNMTTCIRKTEPTVAAQIDLNYDNVYDYVQQGMILASTNGFPANYSLQGLGYDVAIKTGTPQWSTRVQDSVFLGYAPADDPQIAFAGVVEGGEYSKYMIRSILELYDQIYGIR